MKGRTMWSFTPEQVFGTARRYKADLPDSFMEVCRLLERHFGVLSDELRSGEFRQLRLFVLARATNAPWDAWYLRLHYSLIALDSVLFSLLLNDGRTDPAAAELLHELEQVEPLSPEVLRNFELLLTSRVWQRQPAAGAPA